MTTFSGREVSMSYDTNGRRSSILFPNGIKTVLSYDESSNLAKIAHQKNNTDVVSYSYSHDDNGNREKMNVVSPITSALAQVNYTYDQVNQLLSATKNVTSNSDEAFSYDDLGNRLKKNNQSTNNSFDINNRIVEDDKFFYSHDENGNLTKKVNKQTGYTFKYVWDFENRLQFVTEHLTENAQATKTHTYMHDALGRRIMKDSNGVTHKYIYDGEDILFEFDNAENLIATYSHGPGIDEPIEMTRSGQTYYFQTDGLGSIVALTNLSGDVVQSYSYSSFGETKVFNASGAEISPSSMIQSPYGYTAREWDYEVGLYFYRARFYDPAQGRFLTEDPSANLGIDTNNYRYVQNNPTKFVDPRGEEPISLVTYIIGATVAGAVSSAVGGLIFDPSSRTIKGVTNNLISGGITGGTLAIGFSLGGLSAFITTIAAIPVSVGINLLSVSDILGDDFKFTYPGLKKILYPNQKVINKTSVTPEKRSEVRQKTNIQMTCGGN